MVLLNYLYNTNKRQHLETPELLQNWINTSFWRRQICIQYRAGKIILLSGFWPYLIEYNFDGEISDKRQYLSELPRLQRIMYCTGVRLFLSKAFVSAIGVQIAVEHWSLCTVQGNVYVAQIHAGLLFYLINVFNFKLILPIIL